MGSQPKIERSLLDGSQRIAIANDRHVVWPNGITIDHSNNHIYWVDGRLNTIKMADFDGKDVKVKNQILLFCNS